MRIETGANVGDELFYIILPNKSCKHKVVKYKIRDIGVTIYKDKTIYKTFSPEIDYRDKNRVKSFYLNEGCFLLEKKAVEVAKKLSDEMLKEQNEQREFDKKYAREKAVEEINAIAKKNSLKIIIE